MMLPTLNYKMAKFINQHIGNGARTSRVYTPAGSNPIRIFLASSLSAPRRQNDGFAGQTVGNSISDSAPTTLRKHNPAKCAKRPVGLFSIDPFGAKLESYMQTQKCWQCPQVSKPFQRTTDGPIAWKQRTHSTHQYQHLARRIRPKRKLLCQAIHVAFESLLFQHQQQHQLRNLRRQDLHLQQLLLAQKSISNGNFQLHLQTQTRIHACQAEVNRAFLMLTSPAQPTENQVGWPVPVLVSFLKGGYT